MGDGKRYNSSRRTAEMTSLSRATIRRKLANPNETDWFYLENEKQAYGYSPIFAKRDNGPSVFFFEYSGLFSCYANRWFYYN